MDFQTVVYPLSLALGLSLTVERILEFSKNLLERIIGSKDTRRIPGVSESNEKLEALAKLCEEDKNSRMIEKEAEQVKTGGDPKNNAPADKLVELEKKGEWDERFPADTILVEPASAPEDGRMMKLFVLQLLGFSAGILLARFFNVQLFNSFLKFVGLSLIPDRTDFILTGLLIGGGSGPINVLIRFISERKMTAVAEPHVETGEETSAEPPKPQAPAVIKKPSDAAADEWVNIPYGGGVDRDILEEVHRRKKDPDMIVYHHTAMSSRSTFEDVVRVIKNRKWLTGYNCVIQADGSIHPFCRWDRYGNHAVGYNMRSLGIAFNGNYETDPNVPFSNPDGKYGPPRPTEGQLKAGARVVTLWTFLYGIDPDFEKNLIPHRDISTKSCPGSGFPYDEFRQWIDLYRDRWEKSSAIKERIEEFKRKPYIYLNKEKEA